MVEVATSLKDLSSKACGIGVPVSHSFEGFDFIIESLTNGGGEPGYDIGLNPTSILSDGLCQCQEWF